MIPIHPSVIGDQWYWNVRCVNKPGLVEADIRFISRGIVAHTEAIFDSVIVNGETHTNVSIGARAAGGVAIRALDDYPTDYRFAIPCTKQQYDLALAFLIEQIGKPYDFVDIAEILADWSRPRNWRDDVRWICSELVTATTEAGGITKPLPSSVNLVTPQDDLLMLSAMAGVVG